MNEADPTYQSLLQTWRDDPFSVLRFSTLADYLDEHGGAVGAEKAAIMRGGDVPLTDFEAKAVLALAGCSFAPATWDKRFAADVGKRVLDALETKRMPSLTVKQYLWTVILLRRYRRTVSSLCYVTWAEGNYNRALKLLGIKHLKPIRLSEKRSGDTDVRMFPLFDES